MNRKTVKICANSNTNEDKNFNENFNGLQLEKILARTATETKTGRDAVGFTGGVIELCFLVGIISYSPTLCPLVYLGFAAVYLPYRIISFSTRKWTFFLVDFCYFANLACCAFLLLRPEDRQLEAAVYVLCEGPLAAALIAWQCAWLLGSPDHVISVLIHLMPGLAMYCHRFLAFSRQPLLLASRIGLALLGKADLWATTSSGMNVNGGSNSFHMASRRATAIWSQRLQAAAAVFRGGIPCPAFPGGIGPAATVHEAAYGPSGLPAVASCDAQGSPSAQMSANTIHMLLDGASSSASSVRCYTTPAGPPPPCPTPAWLWLGVAPLVFYLAWQILYFLIVQVAFRRMILSGGYETSYRALARRAQRANSPLNRLVRSGGVGRRLFMYGLLQLAFTLVTQALAVVTYHSFAAATLWQVVKFLVPLYLGACHQCQRLPAQQLRAVMASLAAAGVLVSDGQASSKASAVS
ncbi:hypothetical protein Vretimale_5960 [Volvox reticuliferus]|uniref:Glycerophosphocholine acyltransferase 1 n=1 Tax=Volvox reticuliferus TaxID=1737510 RepID=A0A8J4G6K1_9CHLO|nr:hypothetical protein Vretimale_5960 [Volvox reticuliferus]